MNDQELGQQEIEEYEYEEQQEDEEIKGDEEEIVQPSRVATPPVKDPIQINSTKSKLRFPILTSRLLQQAMVENQLSHDQKDSLIRNPNIHTILRIKLNINSPRLMQAMKAKHLQSKDLKVFNFDEVYDKAKPPLENLIFYLKYITTQYNLLNELLRTRNTIKRDEKKKKKLLESKDVKQIRSQMSMDDTTIMDSSMIILTDVPSISIMQSRKQAKQSPPKLLRDGSSFLKNRSVRSLGNQSISRSIISHEDRKNMFDKKNILQEKQFSKFQEQDRVQNQIKELFYHEQLPQQIIRAEKIKQDHIDMIQAKMIKSNLKVIEMQQKNTLKREELLEQYEEKVDKIEENIQKHANKKIQLKLEQITSSTEQKRAQEQLDDERDLRRLYFQRQEDKQISAVMDKLQVKKNLLQENLQQKKLSEQFRKKKLVMKLKKKQQMVQSQIKNAETETMKDYLERQQERQNQILSHDNRLFSSIQDKSLRNLTQFKKVEQQQLQNEEKQQFLLEKQIETRQERIESVLERHSSLIELRKVKLIEKSQIRQNQTKVNHFNNLLTQKKNHDHILQKCKGITLRNETSKIEEENFQQYRMGKLLEIGQRKFDKVNPAKPQK